MSLGLVSRRSIFIMWWLVLFAILPFGLRTQDEDEDVTLGTVSSAPRGPHMLRAVVRTTHRLGAHSRRLLRADQGLGSQLRRHPAASFPSSEAER